MNSKTDFRGKEVRFAMQDPAIAIASIFRPVVRGPRPAGLKIFSRFDGFNLMFTCFEAIDSLDQSVLLSAIGMAGLDSKVLNSSAKGDKGKRLWEELDPEDAAMGGSAVVVRTSLYSIVDAVGLTHTGKNYERIRDSLYRLSQVGCRVRKEGHDWGMRLLSQCSLPDGQVAIALNERFAHSLAGRGQFVKIDLEERRKLDHDSSQIFHGWLCAITRPGCKGVFMGVDKLAEKVWGAPSKNASTNRTRRRTLNESVAEIESIGWKVERRGAGGRMQLRFKRPNPSK
jgi:hypothetical protein